MFLWYLLLTHIEFCIARLSFPQYISYLSRYQMPLRIVQLDRRHNAKGLCQHVAFTYLQFIVTKDHALRPVELVYFEERQNCTIITHVYNPIFRTRPFCKSP